MKYGFDFNKNSQESVGTLRSFVKKSRNVRIANSSDKKSDTDFSRDSHLY